MTVELEGFYRVTAPIVWDKTKVRGPFVRIHCQRVDFDGETPIGEASVRTLVPNRGKANVTIPKGHIGFCRITVTGRHGEDTGIVTFGHPK